jgi:hypothetical protein
MKRHAELERILDAEEAITQRILDAVAKADSKLVGNLDDSLVSIACTCYLLWPAMRDWREVKKWWERRRRRIVKAARALQKDLLEPEDIEWAKRVEQLHTPRKLTRDEWEKLKTLPSPENIEWAKRMGWGIVEPPLTPAERERDESSALIQLVGNLAKTFECAFQMRAGYTTNPDTGETDGPFIRFVEQAFREFGVTKNSNQPYQRRSIADALTQFRKQGARP